MKLHGNAALMVNQRQELKRLREAGLTYRELTQKFGVHMSTVWRWTHRDSPLDLSTAAKQKRGALNPQQQEAIRGYRKENPQAGARTIVAVLSRTYGPMSHATVSRFLKREALSRPRPPKAVLRQPLKVGRHRLQMDIQQLPAVKGGEGFEYKVSIIHMATRMKFSDIYPELTAEVVVQALRKALAHLPPFFFSVDR